MIKDPGEFWVRMSWRYIRLTIMRRGGEILDLEVEAFVRYLSVLVNRYPHLKIKSSYQDPLTLDHARKICNSPWLIWSNHSGLNSRKGSANTWTARVKPTSIGPMLFPTVCCLFWYIMAQSFASFTTLFFVPTSFRMTTEVLWSTARVPVLWWLASSQRVSSRRGPTNATVPSSTPACIRTECSSIAPYIRITRNFFKTILFASSLTMWATSWKLNITIL